MDSQIKEILNKVPGGVGLYYLNLTTGRSITFNEHERFIAASVIKLPIFVETLRQIEDGIISKDMKVKVLASDKVPSCGALNYMHDDLEVTIEDLYTLMIILSDNTATNILINILGMDNINSTMEKLGLSNIIVNRLLFDVAEQKKGKENYFSAKDIGLLLEKIYNEEIINKEACLEIQRVLKMQQLNSKIPHLLPNGLVIGHKTGEDAGITHDVGIIYSENPFILCFASNDTHVPTAEDALRKIALLCYNS